MAEVTAQCQFCGSDMDLAASFRCAECGWQLRVNVDMSSVNAIFQSYVRELRKTKMAFQSFQSQLQTQFDGMTSAMKRISIPARRGMNLRGNRRDLDHRPGHLGDRVLRQADLGHDPPKLFALRRDPNRARVAHLEVARPEAKNGRLGKGRRS